MKAEDKGKFEPEKNYFECWAEGQYGIWEKGKKAFGSRMMILIDERDDELYKFLTEE